MTLSKMEQFMVSPGQNVDMYRRFVPLKSSYDNKFDFVEVNNDGKLLVGTSNMTGKIWDGTIFLLSDYKKAENLHTEKLPIEYLKYGVTDGKFIPENKVLISLDSGEIFIADIVENDRLQVLENWDGGQELDSHATEISLFCRNDSFVTSCYDGEIRLWDLNNGGIKSLHSYRYCHYRTVSSVNTNPNDPYSFVSCSYDKRALLWDKRAEKFSKVIYENEFCALTRIEWHSMKPNIVAVGSSAGDIYLVDIREPKQFLSKYQCFKNRIHKTRFSPTGLLAVCADNNTVKVLDCNNDDMKLVHCHEKHSKPARGLAWKDNILISCGWDTKIYLNSF